MKMLFESIAQECRSGLRSLLRTPLSTAISLVSLALGIGATTAMYSVIYGVIIDPFPYKDVNHLMSIRVSDPASNRGQLYYTTDQFLEFAERSRIFSGVTASSLGDVIWTGDSEPQRLRGNYIAANGFEVMGVPPLIGRTTTPDDVKPGAAPVTVLGYKFWMRQFGGKRQVLGTTLRLNDVTRTVIGVMPPRFMWRGADVYVPLAFARGHVVEGVENVHVVGRLKFGVTNAQAQSDLTPIIVDLQHRDPSQFPPKWRVDLLSFKETFPSGIRHALWILFGAVGLLLLIACANVSGLLLTKALTRQREMAVRASLGASEGRIIRLLLAESLLLGFTSAVFGIAFAFAILRGILALVPPDTIPDESVVVINMQVLWFTLAVALVTSVLFGLAPALHGSTKDLAVLLREVSRGTSGGTRQRIMRNALVVSEVALSTMLLVGAALTIRSLLAVEGIDLGFPPEHVLTVRIPLSDKRYTTIDQKNAFFGKLLDQLQNIPGITAVGLNTSFHPLGDYEFPITVSGVKDERRVEVHQISTGYLKVFGIRTIAGRELTIADISDARPVAMVNGVFQKRYFGGHGALGQTVRIPRLTQPPFRASTDAFQIVGISRDVVNEDLNVGIQPEMFIPYTIPGAANQLAILTQGSPSALAPAVRRSVYSVDALQPVDRVQPLTSLLNDWIYSGLRFNFVLFAFFAVLGLCLTTIGVYGVISNLVSQRQQEIGVRIAIGASFSQILNLVLWQGARLISCGLVLGLIGSFAAARVMSSQLSDVSPFDPLSYAGVSLVLCLVSLSATLLPALRAAGIDPVNALRYE